MKFRYRRLFTKAVHLEHVYNDQSIVLVEYKQREMHFKNAFKNIVDTNE